MELFERRNGKEVGFDVLPNCLTSFGPSSLACHTETATAWKKASKQITRIALGVGKSYGLILTHYVLI